MVRLQDLTVYMLKLSSMVDIVSNYICRFLNLFLKHGYVPDVFCQSIVISLVKCRNGDLSDINNYRANALANSVTKILETV